MTRDEILSMPAGRELDVLIAEKIFNYKWVDTKCMYGHPVHALVPPGWNYDTINGCGHDERDTFAVSFYSTNIAAAWEVVEKFDYLKLVKSFGLSGVKWIVKISDNIEVFENTPPLAICRAALLAVTENES